MEKEKEHSNPKSCHCHNQEKYRRLYNVTIGKEANYKGETGKDSKSVNVTLL